MNDSITAIQILYALNNVIEGNEIADTFSYMGVFGDKLLTLSVRRIPDNHFFGEIKQHPKEHSDE